MSNTINNTTLINSTSVRSVYVTLLSDGSNETGTIIFDSSAFNGVDSLKNRIMELYVCSNVVSSTGRLRLLWDATTDVIALPLPNNMIGHVDFSNVGGVQNYAGTGITGDILITTTGLASGDSFMFILVIRND